MLIGWQPGVLQARSGYILIYHEKRAIQSPMQRLTLVSSPRGNPFPRHGLAGTMPLFCDEPFTAVWLSSSRQAASMASTSRRVLARKGAAKAAWYRLAARLSSPPFGNKRQR
jgi:hypothetical protein